MRYLKYTFILTAFFMVSCVGSGTLRPYQTERVMPGGIESKSNESLEKLPAPKNKIVAAVYRFRDQTGQYKPSSNSISYSTAVTQGATSILIKAISNSGWFTPIEREGISNLLNERRIIQSTRQKNNDNTQLHPLLFAGVVLEGGIIGYDSNVMTGGSGVRYLGMDVSGQYRKDQVTIYLRAVSTSTGRILKTVHTTKSILSQKLSGGLFRYVDANKLLESEVGVTFNEPPVMAVTEAIDEAVKELVVEGVKDGLWQPADMQDFNTYQAKYDARMNKQAREQQDYFGLTRRPSLRSGLTLSTNFAIDSHIGSYGDEWIYSGFVAQLEQSLSPAFSLKLDYQRSNLGRKDVFKRASNNIDLMINGYLTPGFNLSPYVAAGGGIMVYDHPQYSNMPEDKMFTALTSEAGLDYRFNDLLGIKLGFNYRYFIKDGIDGVKLGNVHDQQWSVMAGVSISPHY